MGRPKFPRKQYDTPLHPWKEERIKSERALIRKYGLKNHREVWKARTQLRKYRGQARELLARFGSKDPQVEKEGNQLLLHLTRMGILTTGGTLDDVLALETENILGRRLQTLVYQRGLANTSQQARQLVSHGHISIENRRITIPSYLVTKDEENNISYANDSPLTTLSHPARPKTDVYKPGAPVPSSEKQPQKPPTVLPPTPPQPTAKPSKKQQPEQPTPPQQKQQPQPPTKEEPSKQTETQPTQPPQQQPPAPEKKNQSRPTGIEPQTNEETATTPTVEKSLKEKQEAPKEDLSTRQVTKEQETKASQPEKPPIEQQTKEEKKDKTEKTEET